MKTVLNDIRVSKKDDRNSAYTFNNGVMRKGSAYTCRRGWLKLSTRKFMH